MKRMCIVVPYRDREEHLKKFYPAMTEFLKTGDFEYDILIVEQTFDKPFNRAKLLNVGFSYTNAEYDYYCYHDVDMLPQTADYGYCSTPTHLATEAEQFGYKLPYNEYFGGVTIFDRESFQKINGYSNEYFGWGAEDDDVFRRCQLKGITLARKKCRYTSLSHDRHIDNVEYNRNISLLKESMERIETDGLNSLKYELRDEDETLFGENVTNFKRIKVEI